MLKFLIRQKKLKFFLYKILSEITYLNLFVKLRRLLTVALLLPRLATCSQFAFPILIFYFQKANCSAIPLCDEGIKLIEIR